MLTDSIASATISSWHDRLWNHIWQLKKYRLVVYSDTDWVTNIKNWKSTTEFLIKIVKALIHWRSIKQTGILLSTTETEYIAVSETAKNIVITCEILHKLNII